MHVFLYDPASVTREALTIITTRGFNCIPLTDNPQHFWANVQLVGQNESLAILSHGDQSGPLMVRGDEGDDMTSAQLTQFAQNLAAANITLFLLSCHTGGGPFCQQLTAQGVRFVAPVGYAALKLVAGGVNIFSVEDGEPADWDGDPALKPTRNSKPLYFTPR